MQALGRLTSTPAHEGRATWARERQPPEHLRQDEQQVGARKHEFNDFRSGDLQKEHERGGMGRGRHAS